MSLITCDLAAPSSTHLLPLAVAQRRRRYRRRSTVGACGTNATGCCRRHSGYPWALHHLLAAAAAAAGGSDHLIRLVLAVPDASSAAADRSAPVAGLHTAGTVSDSVRVRVNVCGYIR